MRPEVKIFPPQDNDFRGEVQRALEQLTSAADGSARMEPTDLVALVRSHYPNVSVTIRDDFSTVGSHLAVWYIFRDHRIRPDDRRRERLYAALARGRNVIDESQRAIGRSWSSLKGSEGRWRNR